MLIAWNKKELTNGFVFEADVVDGYDIHQNVECDKFFVHCTGADRDPIGPFNNFKEAEDVVIKIEICLTKYEEALWRVIAAQLLSVLPGMHDGTASMLDEEPTL